MNDRAYFSYLYDIARVLNKDVSLHCALQKSLKLTAKLLKMDTAWIWLTERNCKSVYLAASYNLPPALHKHPERLSGYCYCIQKYLSDDMDSALNISEILCSRLKDVDTGTNNLKFHASIPLFFEHQKIGLINLLTKESRQLNDKELHVLSTASELIGATVHRMMLIERNTNSINASEFYLDRIAKDEIIPKIQEIIDDLTSLKSNELKISVITDKLVNLKAYLKLISEEIEKARSQTKDKQSFQYPNSPLTKREIEVLSLIEKGFVNKQIGQHLYISESTVKFHITSLLAKLNAKNRAEAVHLARNRGIIGT